MQACHSCVYPTVHHLITVQFLLRDHTLFVSQDRCPIQCIGLTVPRKWIMVVKWRRVTAVETFRLHLLEELQSVYCGAKGFRNFHKRWEGLMVWALQCYPEELDSLPTSVRVTFWVFLIVFVPNLRNRVWFSEGPSAHTAAALQAPLLIDKML